MTSVAESPSRSIVRKLNFRVASVLAAGEVLIRPVNAIKELVENSIDAGANHITITLDSISRFQIRDNGHGISRSDLDLICQRHTTSKISTYTDLRQISSLGFRGEALASICQVANLVISSKQHGDLVGNVAKYFDGSGRPTEDLVQVAMNSGTHILVDNLFGGKSAQNRFSFLLSPSMEILLIQNYIHQMAIHHTNIAFVLRRKVKNNYIEEGSSSGKDDRLDLIQSLIMKKRNPKAIQSAIAFSSSSSEENYSFSGVVIPLFTSLIDISRDADKNVTFVLFINDRLVDCKRLRKALQPLAGFIYLNVRIKPDLIDVNVHPTKREISTICEDAIVTDVCKCIENLLIERRENMKKNIKTDEAKNDENFDACVKKYESFDLNMLLNMSFNAPVTGNLRRPCNLDSVRDLSQEIDDNTNAESFQYLQSSLLVGLASNDSAFVHCGTSLCMVNIDLLTRHLFYQIALTEFGNYGKIQFKNRPTITKLLRFAMMYREAYAQVCWSLDYTDNEQVQKVNEMSEEQISYIESNLLEHYEILDDYFSISINPKTRELNSIPLLTHGTNLCTAQLLKVPYFILMLGASVPWDSNDEAMCFRQICTIIGALYAYNDIRSSLQQIETDESKNQNDRESDEFARITWPLIKNRLKPPFGVGAFCETLTNLSSLYKIFERC